MAPSEMTFAPLFLWIVGGFAIQLAVWLGVGFWRHWGEYQALRTVLRRVERIGVSPEEVASSSPGPALGAAWNGFRHFRVRSKEMEDAAQQICSFYLQPEDGLPLPAFRLGQFLTFRLDLPTSDGKTEQVIRCYSLSDAPHTGFYRVSIKRVLAPTGSGYPPGQSSNYFHDHVNVGDTLQVRAPGGHFHIDHSDAPVVLIAGGIGITPMLSMLNGCMVERPGREVWLYYGVRNSTEVIQYAHLQALAGKHLNFRLRLCFSDPLLGDQPECAPSHQGRIDVGLLRSELPLKPYHFYICGPTPMMESLVLGLEAWGVPDSRIHYEAFGPASIKPAVGSTDMEFPTTTPSDIVVTFVKSGKEARWSPESGSLLEFAEAQGIAIASGCRAGGCGTCQTAIQSGEVVYQQSPDCDPEPGTCLMCVCTPRTHVKLEA